MRTLLADNPWCLLGVFVTACLRISGKTGKIVITGENHVCQLVRMPNQIWVMWGVCRIGNEFAVEAGTTLPIGIAKRGKITANDKPLRDQVVGTGQTYR